MLAWLLGFATHISLYHLIRLPAYAGRLAIRSPHGLARTMAGWRRWLFDAEGEPLRRVSADRADAETYLKLARQRDRRVRWRAFLTGVLVLALTCAAVLVALTPGWARLGLLLVALGLLGTVGQPADRPLTQRAVVVPKAPRLTSEMVVKALSVLGLAGINQALAKDPKAIEFVSPIHRDGPGWRADINLPAGVTVGEVADRRDKLASGLGRPLGCVWPEGNPEVHPGRLVLWVGDQDMAKTRQGAWPLGKHGTTDLFRPFAFGTDQRGRLVTITLMFASMVIGSVPRMGKTFAMRLLLLAAALDPRAELHVYDLRGTGDFAPLEPVCHRYRAGDDDHDIAYLLGDLRELQAESRRRSRVIRELPRHRCPESKVTPELAGIRSLRLHPLVLAMDECQCAFEHPDHGAEIQAICEDLVRRFPATGVIPLFGTQRPDAKSLPTGISANAVLRFCLKVMGQMENDMVLGTSMYKNGVRATMFARSDKGIGYLAGEADDPQIVRSYYVDAPAAERIVARARALREQAGTLSGHALGEEPADQVAAATTALLADIVTVVPPAEDKVASEPLAALLAATWPDRYGELTKDQLNASLRALGIDTNVQVNRAGEDGERRNLRGITRQSVADALTQRGRPRRADQ
jgi:S-DNA-T family DNA segregation ATPase FtsK/SpoIIIE